MCGIVGYIGPRNATDIILNGLKRLEYRGYDSAGLAVLENNQIVVRREVGKLSQLSALVRDFPVHGNIGIGHTRWATHGQPSTRNAHPHQGMTGDVVVVHNGIVENYIELRNDLIAEGAIFKSETDTEVIVHLVERYLSKETILTNAVIKALTHLKGAHGIVLISSREPDKIIAARIGNAGGVVIGIGKQDVEDSSTSKNNKNASPYEMFIASDLPAILEHTRQVIFLESRQIAVVSRHHVSIQTLDNQFINPVIHNISWDPITAEKGTYRHFMHKEIHEQVRSLTDTIAGRVDFKKNNIRLPELNLTTQQARKIQKIIITACGTAAHAGNVGKVMIEQIARLPVEVDIASEFRYRNPIVDENTVVLAISQSGETADTLAAMDEARSKGAVVWSIVNAIGSQAIRLANGFISMQTGPEIGVASTKAFTAPLVNLYMLAVLLADLRSTIDNKARIKLVSDLRLIPDLVGQCLDRESSVQLAALALKDTSHCLYLGRGINMPIAYEGALKLKEISYIHAEGYPAGEMKHGPIALVDRNMPVIVLAPYDPWYEKMLSQIEQVKSRGGIVYVVTTDGNEKIKDLADHVLYVPPASWLLSPIITVIPLQLLAYHIAALRGLDVDQPRNLAKSVTVE